MNLNYLKWKHIFTQQNLKMFVYSIPQEENILMMNLTIYNFINKHKQ